MWHTTVLVGRDVMPLQNSSSTQKNCEMKEYEGFCNCWTTDWHIFAPKTRHHFYMAAWDDFLFVSHYDLNCQHEVFNRKIGYFHFFQTLQGLSPLHPPYCELYKNKLLHTFYQKPNYFCMLSHLKCLPFPHVPSAFDQPESTSHLGTRLPYLFLAFFCLQLFSSTSVLPLSPTCERKHAVNFPQH